MEKEKNINLHKPTSDKLSRKYLTICLTTVFVLLVIVFVLIMISRNTQEAELASGWSLWNKDPFHNHWLFKHEQNESLLLWVAPWSDDIVSLLKIENTFHLTTGTEGCLNVMPIFDLSRTLIVIRSNRKLILPLPTISFIEILKSTQDRGEDAPLPSQVAKLYKPKDALLIYQFLESSELSHILEQNENKSDEQGIDER